jgi:hypothetical protein
MAQTSWPFENIDTSETQYSQLFRNLGEGPVEGHGFELEPYADSTGMNVKVKSGQALVRGHYYDSTGTETIIIPAADSTNPRIDRIVLRLDPTANSILLHRLAGTPNASPSAPALTQTDGAIYDLPLAQVYVAANETIIAPGDVTDERTIFSPWTGSVTVAIADVTGLQSELDSIDSALDTKAPLTPSVNAKTGAYTLTAADKGEFITCSGTFTITIPNATFAAGDRVDFVNIGTGVITFAGSGVTINSIDSAVTIDTQWAGATFFFTSASAGVLIGKLA